MPGEKSLALGEYYGHKSNNFWPLLFALYNQQVPKSYDQKINFLYEKGIAVWDVLRECYREGSSDSNIKKEVVNDFDTFYKLHSKIHSVFWDSITAQKLYQKHVGMHPGKNYYLLPSPSPRYARLSFEEKLKRWQQILTVL